MHIVSLRAAFHVKNFQPSAVNREYIVIPKANADIEIVHVVHQLRVVFLELIEDLFLDFRQLITTLADAGMFIGYVVSA